MSKNNILIIDDSKAFIEALSSLLIAEYNCNIYSADSGLKGIELLKKHKIDIVFLDIMMPEMDGYQTAEKIRSTESLSNIPIIFMTAFSPDKEKIEQNIGLGVVDCIIKDSPQDEFKRLISLYLRFVERESKFNDIFASKVKNKNVELKQAIDKLNHEIIAKEKITEDLKKYQKRLEVQNEELLRTQRDLRKSYEKYATLFHYAPVGFVSLNASGIVTDANITFSKILGYKIDSFFNKPFASFIDDDFKEDYFRSINSLNEYAEQSTLELPLIKQDGSIFYAQLDLKLFINRDTFENEIRISVIDISIRKEAEQNSLKRELEYKRLAMSIPNTDIVMFDSNLKIVLAHGNELDKIGFSYKKAVGKKIGHVYNNPVCDVLDQHFINALKGKSSSTELLINNEWFFVQIVPLADDNNEIYGGLSVYQNITVQKKANEELRASEERFSNAFYYSHVMLGFLSYPHAKFIDVNEEALRFSGFTRDELIGKSTEDMGIYFTPEDRTIILKKIAEVGSVRDYEMKMIIKDGSVKTVSISIDLINMSGELVLLVLFKDLTEQRIAEDSLRLSMNLYHSTVNSLTDWIHVINSDFKVVLANSAFSNTLSNLGLAAENVVGTDLRKFLPPNDINKIIAEYMDVFFSGEPKITEEMVLFGDKKFYTRTIKFPIIDNNKVTQIVTAIHNITDIKVAEEKLLESEKKYRGITDNAPDTIIIHKDGKIIFINPAGQKLLGITTTDINQDYSIFDFFPEKERNFIKHRINLVQEKNIKALPRESLLIPFVGAPIVIETSSVPITHNGTNAVLSVFRDISARKKQEKEIIENQSKLAEAQRIGRLGNWEWNLDTNEITGSDEFFRIIGTPDEKKIKVSQMQKTIHPDDKQRVLDTIRIAKDKFEPYIVECRHVHTDGSVVFTYSQGFPQLSSENVDDRVYYGITKDITDFKIIWNDLETLNKDLEQKVTERTKELNVLNTDLQKEIQKQQKTEKSLIKSKRRFQEIMDSANDGIISINSEQEIILFNHAAERIFGYTYYEIVGKNLNVLIPQRYHGAHPEHVKGFRNLSPSAFFLKESSEILGIRKNGEEFLLEASISKAVFDDDKETIYTAVVRDITIRKKTEELIKTANDRLLTVLNSLDSYVYVSDLNTNEIIFANQTMIDLFGDFSGKKCYEVLKHYSNDDTPCRFCNNLDLFDENGNFGKLIEWEIYSRKNKKWYLIHRRAINWIDGNVVRLEIGTDITEKKHIELEIEKNLAKEQALNEFKSQIISTISHEYRTPLTIMSSSTDFLEKYFLHHDKEKFDKHISKINQSIEKLISLLDDVLIYGKLESGLFTLNIEKLDLIELADLMIDESRDIDKNRHKIKLNTDSDSILVNSDRKIINHVVSNFLSNALKYSPNASEVIFEIKEFNDSIEVSVIDNGIGIPEKEMEKVFETFYRATNVGSISGTGLGLSISRGMVELINGKIKVKSQIDRGSVFTLVLPNK